MNIELIRGDTLDLKFQRKLSNNEVITEVPDKMYFTVKSSYYDEDYLFQKRLEDGSITFNSKDNYYYFTIEPEDTNDLNYSTYVYDIEIIKDGIVKTILKGKLKIKEEVTFALNESVEISEA